MVAFDVAPGEEGLRATSGGNATAARRARTEHPRLGIAGKIALLAISFGIVTAVVVSLFLYNAALDLLAQRQQQDQAATIRFAGTRIVLQVDAARRDALFLLQTPAVQGFVRASTNGTNDPLDDSALTLTQTRVGAMFAALLTARPAYQAIRFLDQRGYETINAVRSTDGTVAVVPPGDLQRQASRPYFAEAAKLAPGIGYVSDPELLRDLGKIVEPRAPVSQVSVPVRNDAGAFLGVVVVSIDARRMFTLFSDAIGRDARVYIANDRGDYLVNPDASKTYGFETGDTYRIQDDFPALAPLLAGTIDRYSAADRHVSKATLFAAQTLSFDSQHPKRHFIVATEQAVSVPSAQIVSGGLTIAGVAALVILMGGATALVLLKVLVRPLHRMRKTAVNLAASRHDVDIGQLTLRNDEIGDLATSIDFMARAITERENRLTAQAFELKRSNQDLAQFAYVASHDLQEPLRMVGSYLDLLSRRYKGKLDTEADEFIGFAVDGAARMKRLINDLLGYSRAGNTPLKWERVDIGELLNKVLTSLGPHLQETAGRVELTPMPTVTGDAAQLERVFQNLIDNALKYHGEEPPRIRISAASTENGWRFAIADNGIGIDPRFNEQIFEIFKRLHPRDQYSGTGIGLAVTKLAVERHGGHIWVEAGEGGGSVFYFTIPEARMD